MAQTPSVYYSHSRAPISFEYRSEISQERKALRRETIEAIKTFDAGKLVTWEIRRRIGGGAFEWKDRAEGNRYRKVERVRIRQDIKRVSGRRPCVVWK